MSSLYPGDNQTLTRSDYEILLKLATGAKSMLEIGPGNSTWAWIEAGVERIVALEYDDEWFEVAVEKFKDYPQVQVRRYLDVAPTAKGELDPDETFDMAFVDSPKGYKAKPEKPRGGRLVHPGYEDCSRLNTCALALDHAPTVILHDAFRPIERASLGRLNALGCTHQLLWNQASREPQIGIAVIKRSDEWLNRDKTLFIGPSTT